MKIKNLFSTPTYFLLLGVLVLAGCDKPPTPVSTESSSNSEIKVDFLFEKDGVKVYRFCDGRRWIYYTDARGRVEWTTKEGKLTMKHSVETVE